MDFQSFLQQSQTYLSDLLIRTSINLDDPQRFSSIEDPYQLGQTRYKIYNSRELRGYKPNKDRPELVAYTFFVLRPLYGVKEKFLEEVNKKNRGEQYDSDVIGNYYVPVHPDFVEMKTLYSSLGQMLSEDYFPGKGYSFAFHLVTVTKEFDVAIVFLEVGSIKNLGAAYPNEIAFNP